MAELVDMLRRFEDETHEDEDAGVRIPSWYDAWRQDVHVDNDAIFAERRSLERQLRIIEARANEARLRADLLYAGASNRTEALLGGETATLDEYSDGEDLRSENSDDLEHVSPPNPHHWLSSVTQRSIEVFEAEKRVREAEERAKREVEAERMRTKDELETLRRRVAELELKVDGEKKNEESTSPKAEFPTKRLRRENSSTDVTGRACHCGGGGSPKVASPAKRSASPDDCLICLEPLGAERGLLMPCKHARYHYECAMELYTRNGKCAHHSTDNKVDSVVKIYV